MLESALKRGAFRVLFWNTHRRALLDRIVNLNRRYEPDLIVVAENPASPAALLQNINATSPRRFSYVAARTKWIKAISPNASRIREVIDDSSPEDRWLIRSVSLPGFEDFTLAMVHLPSKTRAHEPDQSHNALRTREAIQATEATVGHRRTIAFGDFNLNPWDRAMVEATGLHAVMSADIVARNERTVGRRRYPFFYNPMWARLGDKTPGTPGTHWYGSEGVLAYYWHTFDQVLVRSEFIESTRHDSIHVPTTDGNTSLIDRVGRPDADHASDHLPLLFDVTPGET
jgi:endonuclease/exonuclease/phosphatase family metal-dependent hydrolase